MIRALAAVAVMSLVAVSCGGDEGDAESVDSVLTQSDSGGGATTAEAADDELVSVVLVGDRPAGDQGPIDAMISGLQRSADANGHDQQYVHAEDPAAYENQLRAIAGAGPDIVITTFQELAGAVDQVAADFPDVSFVTIFASESDQPNVNAVDFEFYKAAYIGGIFAAQVTDSAKLGFVGGAPLPFAWAEFNSFTDGARSINPDIESTATFAEGFGDPAGARELANGLQADGVDFLFTGAGGGDIGVVEAAADGGALVMVQTDFTSTAPANVALIAEIRWADTVQREIEHLLQGGETGRFRYANPESGEITFTLPQSFIDSGDPDRVARAQEAMVDVEAAVAALESGDLVVERDPNER